MHVQQQAVAMRGTDARDLGGKGGVIGIPDLGQPLRAVGLVRLCAVA